MDDIVRQAMAKWPNVPDCYGWLGLDARGQWYMRDDRTQAIGSFASGRPGARGSVLRHDKLIDFIQRNYEQDPAGCWFFQNGPQRVYVELEATPWIWRIDAAWQVSSHAGQVTQVKECLLDEQGKVYLLTELGFGLVHTLDVGQVAHAVEQGLWSPIEADSEDLPARFGYVMSPADAQRAGSEAKAAQQ